MSQHRFGIIGGGIIGLAVAYQLQQKFPHYKIILFEKEKNVGKHQSGNNSGVLHCGLYYKPGSLKAHLAVSGLEMMVNFCQQYNINHEICGKVVVASDEQEATALDDLYERGKANGLKGLKFLTNEELKEREPYVYAHKALLVPQEGIVDYKSVMNTLVRLIEEKGGTIMYNTKIDYVVEKNDELILSNGIDTYQVDKLICCAGLHSDRLYEKLTKKKSPIKIIPFRGEYMEIKKEAHHLVKHLVYPVPDAQYPFLGVHFTRMVNGSKEVGPNAVFATKREGYKNTQISISDIYDSISFKGFWRFISKNFIFSMNEFYSSIDPKMFLKKAQKLIPEIQANDLKKGNAGVRAQAMSLDGDLIMDFNIVKEGRQVHVLNAPSPGATASLAIAQYIIDSYM